MLQRFNYCRSIIRINTECSLQLSTSRNAAPYKAVNKTKIYSMCSDFVVLPIAELANLILLIVFFQSSGSPLAIINLIALCYYILTFSVYNIYIHGTELREFSTGN